jgi:GAF domain-containing protein
VIQRESVHEEERLQVLRNLQLLGSPPDPAMSAICEEAAQAFGVPTALVSLIDCKTQYIKAGTGIDIRESTRESAICNHTIEQDAPLIVPDTLRDSRFLVNPFVIGEPRIRFYAGVPLLFGENIRLGSFCLIDTVPRDFSRDDVKRLEKFASRVIGCLWLHDIRVNAQAYELAAIEGDGRTAGVQQ